MKVISLSRSVTDSNDRDARDLRSALRKKGVTLVNIMSSPGSGKTTLLSRIIKDVGDRVNIGVMEADIASDVDAAAIEKLGAKSIQAHTGGMCHMDAGMTRAAFEAAGFESGLVFLENVGNLICPAEFDTGAHVNVMMLSVSEGDDKPLKYPLMFQKSDALVISKLDALEYFDFELDRVRERALKLNPALRIFPVSAKTGEGMDALENWLLETSRDNEETMTHEECISLALEALNNSYSPYSHFRVGACLLTPEGEAFTGANFENASFGATICAERCAVGNAIAHSRRSFSKIYISCDSGYAWPCGICRQVLNEFSSGDMEVWVGSKDSPWQMKHLSEMLPNGFGPGISG
ncbi:MAG: hydrogenase nickel incorporation protein HypB [Clostridiales bacterium]|nr:hydrogenase nickel incorporation protein HypB [Clostridiales bacterium]